MNKLILTAALAGILWQSQLPAQDTGRAGKTEKEYIEASVVFAGKDVMNIVKDMAKTFSVNYATDYISSMTVIRTVSSGDRYRHLMCVTGMWGSTGFTTTAPKLYFDDRNSYDRFYPADSFLSNSYFPDRQEINDMRVSSQTSSGLERMYTDIIDELSMIPMIRKRALELYSPLNPKHVKDFIYEIKSVRESPSGREYEIGFRTKEGVFPKKNRLYGSGTLHISEDGIPMKVEVRDMEDRYSSFIRHTMPPMPNVTPYTFSVEYGVTSGKIHVSSVRQEVKWVLPEGLGGKDNVFYAEFPPFRNPFRHKMSTTTSISFGAPYFLDSSTDRDGQIRKAFNVNVVSYDLNHYTVDVNTQYWNRVLGACLDMDKVREDLKYEGMTLEEQAEANAGSYLDRMEFRDTGSRDQAEENLKYRCRYARELFRLVYGKEYHE